MDAQDSDDDDHPRKVQAAEVIQRRVRGIAGRSQAQMRAEAALVREEEEAALVRPIYGRTVDCEQEIARLTNQLELLNLLKSDLVLKSKDYNSGHPESSL